MKYKTADLEGLPLDTAVAVIEGWASHLEPIEHWLAREGSYSTDQTAGGRIIDREHIATVYMGGKWRAFTADGDAASHSSYMHNRYIDVNDEDGDGVGPTRLVAAMRAWVAQQLGPEVDL